MRNSVLGLCLFLTACIAVPTPTQPPAIEIVTVALPPSLQPIKETFFECVKPYPKIALFLIEIPTSDLNVLSNDLILWVGEPPKSVPFAAPLVWDEIVIVANSENHVFEDLTTQEIRNSFAGQAATWNGEQVNIWVYPPENELQKQFIIQYLLNQPISSLSHLAPDPPSMRKAIMDDVNAIGLLPRSWMTQDIKSINLKQEEESNLRLPILALANSEPRDGARIVLACMQSPFGQKSLAKFYTPWEEGVSNH